MQKVDHFAFEVSDMDRALEFYTARLGLTLMFRKVDEEHQEAFAFLALDGGNLELLQNLAPDAPPLGRKEPAAPYCPHLALVTSNMDKLVQRVKGKGIDIVKGPLEAPGLAKWVYLSDPDGNVIEYIQWLEGGH